MLRTISFVLLVAVIRPGCSQYLKKLQDNHKPRELTDSELIKISGLSNPGHINNVLDNILIPRVVGTKNHKKVFDYISKELEDLDWHVEIDEFTDNTPKFGKLTFKNIIAKLNPNAERYLTLACHYDSKYFPSNDFVGATDSAVPCAMLLNVARVLRSNLDAVKNNDLSLQLVFFDGEEAFVNWGPKDSIYGARHLAQTYHDTNSVSRSSGENVSQLQKMDMLVLLDLIGHRDASFYSYFPETEKWYVRMANLEDRMKDLGLLKKYGNHVYFKKQRHYGGIEDDHIPFLKRGVPILHLISSPFPRAWHTPQDNRDIVDMNATENIQKILMAFLVEYLNILLDNGNLPEKEL
ncbi:unnamed protein product [Brassicogethes aeneus]|uniref:Glutaminyl-peptide cyclotransferase n=1 Tax=Brassicogethes aeneus TaxID=1431903 RepID=A0A9P0BIC6_BRAAE|nr:unnamed protein product [Brassicogethes aeneus]